MNTKTDPGAKDPLIGQPVGASYIITEQLGSGGMGTVYLAESAALGGQKIAVKVLTTKSREAIARFMREAYAAGKVNDQFSVVGLIDTGVLQTGQHYIALQYCNDGSLEGRLRERGGKILPLQDVLAFMSPVCAALVHAHAGELVHRDIKPANILFVKDGTVSRSRLADFGIVKLRELAGLVLTAPKTIMGTPGYMSPEQWTDTGEVDSRSDIYAIGCVLYELLTGRLPYTGTQNEVQQQVVRNAPIVAPAILRPGIPELWNTTVMRCLAHRREDRIQTILEVILNLAKGIENGEATMGFFAPSLVPSIAVAPTANTISQSAGGAAHTLWSQAHSAIQQRRSQSTRTSRRRTWATFAAGILIGGVAVLLGLPALTRATRSDTIEQNLVATKAADTIPSPSNSGVEIERKTPAMPVTTTPGGVAQQEATSSTLAKPSLPVVPLDAAVEHAARIGPTRTSGGPAIDTGSAKQPLSSQDIMKSERVAAPLKPSVQPAAPAVVVTQPAKRETAVPAVVREVTAPLAAKGSSDSAMLNQRRDESPEKTQRPTEKKPQQTGQGTLHVEVQPWADVVIGSWQDTTPVTHTLPAGRHRVLLRNGKKTESVDVVITPNQTTTITRTW